MTNGTVYDTRPAFLVLVQQAKHQQPSINFHPGKIIQGPAGPSPVDLRGLHPFPLSVFSFRAGSFESGQTWWRRRRRARFANHHQVAATARRFHVCICCGSFFKLSAQLQNAGPPAFMVVAEVKRDDKHQSGWQRHASSTRMDLPLMTV